jgi:hypothetical protein
VFSALFSPAGLLQLSHAAAPGATKRFYTQTLIPYAKRFTKTWVILYKSVMFL